MNKAGSKVLLKQPPRLAIGGAPPVGQASDALFVESLQAAPDYELQTEEEFSLNPQLFTTLLLERLNAEQFRARDFSQHYARLEHYVEHFNLRALPSAEQISKALNTELSGRFSANCIRLRISVCRTEITLTATEFIKPCEPFKLISKSLKRFLPEFKTAVISSSLEAQREAQCRGADSCLLISSAGQVLEGLWSSLFWLDARGEIFSSPLKGILPGIGRENLISKFNVREEEFTLTELLRLAKQVYLISSLQGLVPVSQIDEQSFDCSRADSAIWEIGDYLEQAAGVWKSHG